MVSVNMVGAFETHTSAMADKDLRRQIDRSVSRALVDREYAQLLLDDPTVALEQHGCAPQQYLLLRNIRAIDLIDFARQAQALFWAFEPQPVCREDRLLAATARR
jgi:hypothetical protein